MILLCFDSNALHGDPLLLKDLGLKLLEHARRGTCEIHLSPVVISELDRTMRDDMGGEYDSMRTRIKSFGDRYQTPAIQALSELDDIRSAAQHRIQMRRQELRESPGFFVQSWPTKSVEDVVAREISRRRPFVAKEIGTIGHRDTVIWLGVVELAVSRPNDHVIFVTKDKAFLDDNGLHGDLKDDLLGASVAPTRVSRVRDLYAVVTLLDKAVEADQQRASAQAAIREALQKYTEELVKDAEWGWEWDVQDGGQTEPSIDADIPPELENVTVVSDETQLDISINPDSPETGQPVECTHRVLLSFIAFMTKGDWYGGEYDGVELWDSDWNESYVNVAAHRVLELTTKVTYDPSTDEAYVDELINSRVVGYSY